MKWNSDLCLAPHTSYVYRSRASETYPLDGLPLSHDEGGRLPRQRRRRRCSGNVGPHKREAPRKNVFVSENHPKITTRCSCRDQSPLPSLPPPPPPLRVIHPSGPLHSLPPTLRTSERKKEKKKKGNKEEGNPPTILAVSRPRSLARSLVRSLLFTCRGPMSQRSRLDSSHFVSSRPAVCVSLKTFSNPRFSSSSSRCPDFSKVLRSASAVRLSSSRPSFPSSPAYLCSLSLSLSFSVSSYSVASSNEVRIYWVPKCKYFFWIFIEFFIFFFFCYMSKG